MKELAGYLFHGVKVLTDTGHIIEVTLWPYPMGGHSTISSILPVLRDNECKPILRPLSDLTSEITHKGKVFAPINDCGDFYEEYPSKLILDIKLKLVPYHICEALSSWMFDIHGLIDQGKAISVHDLEVNPYE